MDIGFCHFAPGFQDNVRCGKLGLRRGALDTNDGAIGDLCMLVKNTLDFRWRNLKPADLDQLLNLRCSVVSLSSTTPYCLGRCEVPASFALVRSRSRLLTYLLPTNNVPLPRTGITESNVASVEVSVAVPVPLVRVWIAVVA